jgi:hypothetical protein
VVVEKEDVRKMSRHDFGAVGGGSGEQTESYHVCFTASTLVGNDTSTGSIKEERK